jgi:hypothetical protein
MTREEMLQLLNELPGSTIHFAHRAISQILIELVNRLPVEAPITEKEPNANLQD